MSQFGPAFPKDLELKTPQLVSVCSISPTTRPPATSVNYGDGYGTYSGGFLIPQIWLVGSIDQSKIYRGQTQALQTFQQNY